MPARPARAAGESPAQSLAGAPPALPAAALDDRIAIVGTGGSGKTYAAKGFVERLLQSGARVAIIDPLGVWWGLRASADGSAPGYPVVVFGGKHADVPITADMGTALGRLIAAEALACVVDLSELVSNAARRRFMAAFSEAVYEANKEPLHLVLDEADLWAPQRPIKGWEGLLGHIEEIVRRGRVRGFIPWLITQRPAVVHKDVLSEADILIAMTLTSSQDRDAIGAWIEGQADRQEGKRILADLPRLQIGEGYLWAPRRGLLNRVKFPAIRTFDSSRTPKRGERLATPRTLAEVDLLKIVAALAAADTKDPAKPKSPPGSAEQRHRQEQFEQELAAAKARIAVLEEQNRELNSRLAGIAALAEGSACAPERRGICPAAAAEEQRETGQAAAGCAVRRSAGFGREPASGSAQAAGSTCAACAGPVHLGPGGDARRPQAERRAFQYRPDEPAHIRLYRGDE